MRRGLLLALPLLLAAAPPASARVRVAPGFELRAAVRGSPHASALAFDRAGRPWFTSAGYGPGRSDGVWIVRRGRARQVVGGLNSALGLLWVGNVLFVSHVVPNGFDGPFTGRVVAFSGWNGRRFARRRVVVAGLPTGLHRVNALARGPDGRLFLGVGSRFDARRTGQRRSAAVVSFTPRGRDVRVEASGLRNPYGLAFVPGTRTLLVSEHGRDDLGLRRPPEELNALDVDERRVDFGWPGCSGRRVGRCRGTRTALALLPAHAAPGAVAATGRFGRFGLSAYVTEFGSSFAENPTGGRVVRVGLRPGGETGVRRTGQGPLVSGLGRRGPLALAFSPEGDLWVSEWGRGRLLRVRAKPPAASALLTALF